MDDSSFDTLLDRVIEEVRADPAARDKLLRALLPLEILRLPEEVVDIKRLLERTIQTQEELSATATQLSETQAGILKTQERLSATVERLSETQKEILETQARILKTQEELSATVERLSKTQKEILETQAEILKTQEELSATVERLSETQAGILKTQEMILAKQEEMQYTQKHMLDDIAALKGDSLEMRLEFRLVPRLLQLLKLHRAKVIRSAANPSSDNFFREMNDALGQGIISDRQRGRIYDTDMIMTGVNVETKEVRWIAIEASSAVDFSDIDRAKESADILSAVYGADAKAVAAGYHTPDAVHEYAGQNGVMVVSISRAK